MTEIIKEKIVRCPVCNSDEIVFVFCSQEHEYPEITDDFFTFSRCKICSVYFLSERPSPISFDSIYPRNYYSFQAPSIETLLYKKNILNSIIMNIRKQRFAFVKDYISKRPFTWLDIACGNGRDLIHINHMFDCYATGIDINVKNKSYKGGKITTLQGDFLSYDFKPHSFDIVFSSHAIEHFYNPNEYLKKCRSLLADDGFCIIETPNINCFAFKLFKKYWGGLHVPRHFVLFDEKSLTRLANDNGFEIKSIHYTPDSVFLLWSFHSFFFRGLKLKTLADLFFFPRNHATWSFSNFFRLLCFLVIGHIMFIFERKSGVMTAIMQKKHE